MKILIIDDEPRVLRALSVLLEDHDVITCETVKDAKYMILMNSIQPFDVIICDERMPVDRGHELMSWCNQNSIESKLIMLTSVPIDGDLKSKIKDYEKIVFMSKPWNPRKFVNEVISV